MKTKSSIFLLHGAFDYEGSGVLGAYTSAEAAESAMCEYKVKVEAEIAAGDYQHTEYDRYFVQECAVDAAVIS